MRKPVSLLVTRIVILIIVVTYTKSESHPIGRRVRLRFASYLRVLRHVELSTYGKTTYSMLPELAGYDRALELHAPLLPSIISPTLALG
jgi:hypothetical protein